MNASTRWVLAANVAAALAVAPLGATAQTEFFQCVPALLPICEDEPRGFLNDFTCGPEIRTYITYFGRVSLGPLSYEGPVFVEVIARRIPGVRYPLYVEIVPIGAIAPGLACDLSGRVVLQTWGEGCDEWDATASLNLGSLLEIGDRYLVRLHFETPLIGIGSPPVGCIRVRRDLGAAATVTTTWGHFRQLYR